MPNGAPPTSCTRHTDARQARPDHGRGQRPFHRLGHRRRLRGTRGGNSPSRSRARRWRSACDRLAEGVGASLVLPCDVSDDAAMDETFAIIEREWGRIDFLVHAIGWADKTYLRGRYADTPREAFLQALDISCYSFTAVSRRAAALMDRGGSLLTLTYLGAERVMPHYNVMGVAKAALEASVRYLAADFGASGIRVNAISAGPIKTLAASGIGDFRYILKWNQLNAPLERNVSIEEVGGAGLYLLSDLSSGVTGEVHHVDSGYHTVGMKNPKAPDIAAVSE